MTLLDNVQTRKFVKIIGSSEFFKCFSEKDSYGTAHYVNIRRKWFLARCLVKKQSPQSALSEVNDFQQAGSDEDELLSSLSYIIRYKKKHDYADTELLKVLTSKRSLLELVGEMLDSMMTFPDVLTDLANTKVTPEQYKQFLIDLKAMYSEPTKVTTFQSLMSSEPTIDEVLQSRVNNYTVIYNQWNTPASRAVKAPKRKRERNK
ncbi:hypothetical protein Plhal304r1_c031g0102051 [Plasmopara halstedii]